MADIKHKCFWIYSDWTTEQIPRCFYVGIGSYTRSRGLKRGNSKHTNIARKHGQKRRILEIVATRNEACWLEQIYIKQLDTMHRDDHIGCNFTAGGEGVLKYRHTLETRQRISSALKVRTRKRGYKCNPEHVAKRAASMKGKRHTPEAKAKMSASHKGKTLSSEHRHKLRLAKLGKKLSLERRVQCGAKQRGRKRPPEVGMKISASKKGKRFTEEQRQSARERERTKRAERWMRDCGNDIY